MGLVGASSLSLFPAASESSDLPQWGSEQRRWLEGLGGVPRSGWQVGAKGLPSSFAPGSVHQARNREGLCPLRDGGSCISQRTRDTEYGTKRRPRSAGMVVCSRIWVPDAWSGS